MSLQRFFDTHPEVMMVRLTRVRGSSPREAGTEMFVALTGLHGTIGGGQLEYMAIDKARALLRNGMAQATMDVPLGPEIGQCCGGRVELSLQLMSEDDRAGALEVATTAQANLSHVYVLGAGHVGRALAAQFQHLPVTCQLIDSRAEELALSKAEVTHHLTPLPEAIIRSAPPVSAFIVLTHDHALDFLLSTEALARGDAAYVGLIGSATKRVKFTRYLADIAPLQSPARLICPIGAQGSDDKRPAVIASFVVAEVMTRLTTRAPQPTPIPAQ